MDTRILNQLEEACGEELALVRVDLGRLEQAVGTMLKFLGVGLLQRLVDRGRNGFVVSMAGIFIGRSSLSTGITPVSTCGTVARCCLGRGPGPRSVGFSSGCRCCGRGRPAGCWMICSSSIAVIAEASERRWRICAGTFRSTRNRCVMTCFVPRDTTLAQGPSRGHANISSASD